MTAYTAASGASLLAHGVHWTIVLGGTAGMVALVLPSLLDRFAPRLASWVDPAPRRPRDEHERRVHELRLRLLAGVPSGSPTATPFFPTAGPVPALPAPPSYAARVTAPVALVGSVAAAGVHAAVGAAHLAGQPVLGVLFLLCAAAQLAWAAQLATAPTAPLVLAGIVGNAGLVLAWLLTRTTGLRGLGDPEPVGVWDVLAAGWEVALVVACVRLLAAGHRATTPRPAAWHDWSPAARTYLVCSAALLLLTSTSGVPA